MIRRRLGVASFGLTLLCVMLWAISWSMSRANFALAAGQPLKLPDALQAALESLNDGHYQQILTARPILAESFPSHPLPALMAAEANWGLIFCQTGHITSSEIWNTTTVKTTTFDGALFQAVEDTIATAKEMEAQPDSAALGDLYDGLAHGVVAKLYTLRGEVLKSGQEGKQMREFLLQAAARDSALQAEADAGLGAYNYYADVLSPLLKFVRFFLLIPGGDRQRGLEQLRSAAANAVLVGPEARYELAKIYGLRENRSADALTLFRGLADHYPDNALYALSAALQAEPIGEKPLAVEYARKAVQASARMDAVCQQSIGPASREALQHLLASETPKK
jgi:hypothetical protein